MSEKDFEVLYFSSGYRPSLAHHATHGGATFKGLRCPDCKHEFAPTIGYDVSCLVCGFKTEKPYTDGMVTLSGQYLEFKCPSLYNFTLDEIATGLSRECRWARQTQEFYSVAQHAVLVSFLVPPEFALHALHHDDAEAYLGDMISPMKQQMPVYKEIEDNVQAAIFCHFGIYSSKGKAAVKAADIRVELTEWEQLIKAPAGMKHRSHGTGVKALPYRIRCWDSTEAAHLYRARHLQIIKRLEQTSRAWYELTRVGMQVTEVRKPMSDRAWAAQPAGLREGCTVHVPGVGNL